MEEQTAALLAALKKQASTNVDRRLDLFGSLKSSIKHQRVPESCQDAILECIRTAIGDKTSAQLVAAGFSTLSHLIKRLALQKETHTMAAHAQLLVPILLDHLGNAREAHRSAASALLVELYPYCHAELDAGVHGAMAGSNPRAKETAMSWLVTMNQSHGLPFRTYVNQLVANCEDADPDVRTVAKTAIVSLFQTAPGKAQVNLQKQLAVHGVRKATVAYITAHLDPAAAAGAAADDRHDAPPAPVRERPLPTARAKTLPSLLPDAGLADSLAAEQPPPAETVSMDPIHVYTQRELEDMFRDMAPPFEGRESEQNWLARDKNTLKLRRILKGNAPTEFHAAFMAGMASLRDGILKVANTLRTTMSTNGCQLVQELARTVGPAIDSWVEILLQAFIKMCAATKNIAAQNGNATVDALLSHVSFNNRVLQHVQFASQDKNVQPRIFSAGWVKTLIRKHKSHIDHSGGLDSFDKILKRGLADANPKVRESYRSTYWTFALVWPQKAEAMYETLEKREKTGLDRDPNNPNTSLAPSQTSTVAPSFSRSVGPSAARTSLKEKIAEQRRAKLAASKGVADRPSSAAASYETPRSLSSKSLGVGPRTMSNTSTASNGPSRPPSAMSGEATKSALKSSTGTSTGSLMSGTVRRPIRRPELNRPKTADPYASRQTKITPSTTTTPERTPAVKSLKKSVGPAASSTARPRSQAQQSPTVSPVRSKSRVDTGRTATHRKNPSMGSRGSPVATLHKDEDLTMVKPFIRSQSHHDGTMPFRQRNGMDKRASVDSVALDMDEDNFTMLVPNLARPTSQRVQSTPPKSSPSGGRIPVPSPQAASTLGPSLLPVQSPRQQSPDRTAPEEVEVYEDSCAGDEPSTADQEVDTPVLGELPINERSNERQPSIDSNGDSIAGSGAEERDRGHLKTTSTGSVMHTENADANSPETLKNRQLLASALKKIEGRTVDAGMFRKIQDAIKSGQEIWGPNDEVFGRLLVACLEYFQTPTEQLKLPAIKAGSCKSQALATIRAMLSLYRKETAKYFARVLTTILQAKAQHENTSHIAGDMEATANEIVRYGQVSDCLNAVLALIEGMPASSGSDPAANSTRTTTMSLRTLASLVEISSSKNVVLSQEQTHRLGKLAVRCMEDTDADIRKANIDFCVGLHERIVGPGGDHKAFWEAVAGAGEQQLNLLTYYLAKKQKA
ncbi:protein STU1 [Didymella exigua CBS 183.55]|uniref:Protein STU1 n=1 Tax=Didymella exigua CBS 183.55 TaxID=1150837 RepID=A0A6A5R9Q8_9PLEO|nr:protein STU1 [Didymella exigua CBS 183.55]KAF1924955.1 protein STU1 [Didymella exigua CBS 183.55]